MKELALKLFKKKFNTINLVQIINGVLILIYAATFPMLIDQQKTLTDFIQSLPEGFLKAFNVTSLSMNSFEGYIASKHISPIWVIILLVVALPAGTFISKSLSNKTAELVFSQPLSRVKAGLSILGSAILQVLYFTIPSVLIMIPICWIFGVQVHYLNYLLFGISATAFSVFIASLIFALDVFIGDSGKVTGLIILYTIGSYALDILSKVITDLDFLKYFSFFHYFDASQSLGNAQLDWWTVVGFIVIAVLFSALAIWRFSRKDLD